MNIDEARALLAIDATADTKTIRRAYLRAVKRYKPEQDAEGFQRVRKAFELCSRVAEWQPADPLPDDSPDPDEPASEPTDHEEQWRRFDDLEDALSEVSSIDERLGRMRETLAGHPEDVEIRDWLFNELVDAGRSAEAVEVAREGMARGDAGMVVAIARRAPEALTDAELDAVRREMPEAAFPELLRRGRTEEAFEIAEEAARCFVAAPNPHPGGLFDMVLTFAAAGEVARARSLMADVRGAIESAGLGTRLGPWSATHMMFVTDLLATWEALPPQLSSILTLALRDRGLEHAADSVRMFARREPSSAARASEALSEHAPALASIVNHWLPERRAAPSSSPEIPVWLVVIGVALLLFVFRTCTEERRSQRNVRSALELIERVSAPVDPLTSDVEDVCANDSSLCPFAERLGVSIRDGDCVWGIWPAQMLSEAFTGADAEALAAQAGLRLLDRYRDRCGSSP